MGEISIEVKIADRPYKLTIPQDEEHFILKAMQLIKEKVDLYENKYSYHDNQDLLAMVLLVISTEKIKFEENLEGREEKVVKRLKEIEKMFFSLE